MRLELFRKKKKYRLRFQNYLVGWRCVKENGFTEKFIDDIPDPVKIKNRNWNEA